MEPLSEDQKRELLKSFPKSQTEIIAWIEQLDLDSDRKLVILWAFYNYAKYITEQSLASMEGKDRLFLEVVPSLATQAEEAVKEAKFDDLTGLPRYGHFLRVARTYLDHADSDVYCLAGLFDIRDFKNFNDKFFSHAIGDRVLFRVSQILDKHVRGHDILTKESRHKYRDEDDVHGRQGGDEFVFFIPGQPTRDVSFELARNVSSRFHGKLNDYPWDDEIPEMGSFKVRVDMGIVSYRVRQEDKSNPKLVEGLIQAADRCMYQAKQRSKALAPEHQGVESTKIQIVEFEGDAFILRDIDSETIIRVPIK